MTSIAHDGLREETWASSPLHVIDSFLPSDLALAIRADIDRHFSEPQKQTPATHGVWNYWHVPGQYAYLRANPQAVIERERVEAFHRTLVNWSVGRFGLQVVTWPYLSLYLPGCRQGLHNDTLNGRFGFVFSLTREPRQTLGGETLVFREGDPVRAHVDSAAADTNFYERVAPNFNRLVVFDDRMPHAVEVVQGSMDPREGRFVLHGHLSESGPIVRGGRAAEAVVAKLQQTHDVFRAANEERVSRLHGMFVMRFSITPEGRVERAHVLLDRVLAADSEGLDWPGLRRELASRIAETVFESASEPTEVTAPLVFGREMGR